ncbi:MAG: CRISPR-associated helicase Cas3' [Clostridiaceae bacterium]|nr:CRISPR-associated helicase Cas3' [Clostridiaceae bacterium]
MYCAHIDPITFEEQSIREHLYNVSDLSMEYGAKVSLGVTAKLIGILHDMGKDTRKFDSYIRYCIANPIDKSLKGSVDHSTAGAKFIYDRFYNTSDPYQKLTAQLISLAICSHHGGLIDCLNISGRDVFTGRMRTEKEIYYDEALLNFMRDCSEIANIDKLFNEAKEEIKTILHRINKIGSSRQFGQFASGMLEKYLFSCVIDADRYDTYLFTANIRQKLSIDKQALWKELIERLETELQEYPKQSRIDKLRKEISETCKYFGKNKPGIYQLSVPTGGGKTLSSLRYALEHAKEFNKDRIFYIIPYTTIIDQNAKDIREILGREDIILEHHSNLVIDNEDEDYKLLTERWDSPIILTTMVQFLDTLFSGGTQGVRRMHNLANSIIIFDEIQATPIKCINIFNSAINFLAYICNATIILCTATQPLLSTTEMPLKLSEDPDIISNIHQRFAQFKRVNIVDKRIIGGYSTDSLKNFILEIMKQAESLLVVMNTRNSAKKIYYEMRRANEVLPEEKRYGIFHLSTDMCPTHRLNILKSIKEKLGHERVICISTQLIEAGVNISFECVVRSLAGFDSIAQAAGRCNRHGEKDCRDVYIVNIEGENVSRLEDIKEGQKCTERILDEFREEPDAFDKDLLSPKVMERYYKYYFHERKGVMNYTLSTGDKTMTMYDLLSHNNEAVDAFEGRNGHKADLMLKQAFNTAGDNFQVIDQVTTGVIVPYERGRELITLISGECNLDELKQYLKEAQHYSVNLFESDRRKLERMGGIVGLRDGMILVLREDFYRDDVGVCFETAPMEFCNV